MTTRTMTLRGTALWALMLTACGQAEHGNTPGGEEASGDLTSRVRYASVAAATERIVAILPAEVVSAPNGRAALAPRLPGRLERWDVAVGDVITVGQPVARLDSPDLAGLARRVDALQGLVEAREAQRAAGIATRAEVAEAEAGLAAEAARLTSARRELSGAGAATWRASQAGAVVSLDCEPGQQIGPLTPCLQVMQAEAVQVRVDVPQQHLGELAAIRGRWRGPVHDPVDLTLAQRAPAVHPEHRDLELRLIPDEGVGLTPGVAGRVEILAPLAPGDVLVPRAAVTRLDGGPHVFVEGGGATPVETVGRSPEGWVVRGLQAEARVAVRGVFLLESLALLGEEVP